MRRATRDLRARTRHMCREGLGSALRLVPAGAFDPLRHSFPSTAHGSVRHEVQRRLLEVARHRGVPPEVEVFSLLDNPGVSIVRGDNFIVERLYWFGERYGYEPEVLRWWRAFCGSSTGILELGANIGYFTVQGAKAAPGVRYTAVEPHPGCAAILRRNLQVNDLPAVEVVEAAAVARGASTPMELRLPGGRDHYAAPLTGFLGRNEVHRKDGGDPSYTSVSVETVDLAGLVDHVDLLKLDVEGLEHDLLSSVLDHLRERRPTIFLELLDETPNLRTLVSELCTDAGYACLVPTRDALVPLPLAELPTVTMKAQHGTRDLVLTCAPVD